jgi:hypothetical protein
MASKKKITTTNTGNLQALRIGSRVRCTDDGVQGRIVWANAVAVKIKWDDGAQVTWRRDSLAQRPIAILDPDSGQGQPEAPAAPVAAPAAPAALPQAEPATNRGTPEPAATESTPPVTAAVVAKPGTPTPGSPEGQAAPAASDLPAEIPAKPNRQRKAPAAPKAKKVSALDAAAKVLAEEGRPMSCQELIGVMAAKGYWTSPGGQTPSATLYSAILRELATKGGKARFAKVDRGRFAYRAEG